MMSINALTVVIGLIPMGVVLTTTPGDSEWYSAAFAFGAWLALTLISWSKQATHSVALVAGMGVLSVLCGVCLPGFVASYMPSGINPHNWEYHAVGGMVFGTLGPIALLLLKAKAPEIIKKKLKTEQ